MANMTPRAKRNKRARLIERDGPNCSFCHKYLSDHEITIDHIVPKSQGGGNNIENLRIACFSCNQGRHT